MTTEHELFDKIHQAIFTIRQQKPLILCLTNYVTMDFVANVLLAVGASPLMSCCEEEIPSLATMSQALYINIGTLDIDFVTRSQTAVLAAKKAAIPIILDPVGAGASKIRTETAKQFIAHARIVRGNASEIMALEGDAEITTQGVDSTRSVVQAKDSATRLSAVYKTVVVVSGQEDFITNGQQESTLSYGASLMSLVTGMGCALTALIATFHAVMTDPFEAATLATAYFGLCGSKAVQKADKPGSFRVALIDALYAGDVSK